MTFALSPDRERQLEALFPKYPTKMAVCIPLLHICQEQKGTSTTTSSISWRTASTCRRRT